MGVNPGVGTGLVAVVSRTGIVSPLGPLLLALGVVVRIAMIPMFWWLREHADYGTQAWASLRVQPVSSNPIHNY